MQSSIEIENLRSKHTDKLGLRTGWLWRLGSFKHFDWHMAG